MSRRLDLTGEKFNKLTGVCYAYTDNNCGRCWLFKCDCGNTCIARASQVKFGQIKSCGCLNYAVDDITGKKYNMLTAIEFKCRRNNQTYWKFKCDCGRERMLLSRSVIGGDTKSCGCSTREMKEAKLRIPGSEDNRLYKRYKDRAAKKKLIFNLTEQQFKTLVSGHCHYCGAAPGQAMDNPKRKHRKQKLYSGIDRVENNTFGYTWDNCVSCCRACNFMKCTMMREDFLRRVTRIYNAHIPPANTPSALKYFCEVNNQKISREIYHLYGNYVWAANKRGFFFELTEKEFYTLIKGRCYYCGVIPSQIMLNVSKYSKPELYNGIDRLNNTLNYTGKNVVTCCKHCNIAKSNMTVEDFLSHIAKIYRHSILKSAGDV